MGTVESGATTWVARGWRITASTHAPAAGGGLLGLAAVIESISRYAGTDAVGPFILLVSLVGLLTTVPVALRTPSAAAAVVLAASVLSVTALHTLTAAGVAAQVIAAYRLGRAGWASAAMLLGVPFLVLALAGFTDRYLRIVAVCLAALVPMAAGIGIARRVRREDAENRAAQNAIAGTLLEHTARAERARIARELHDVVAHHISMIAVQAENARLTTPGMPAAGGQRLSAIGDTARAALTEMRRLLGVLREDARADIADRQPQPGLRQLTELLDDSRDAAGTGTRLILRGAPTKLDPGIELAAYRIVQEALTNARRHAPGAAVDVELHYTDTALRLVIRDNGPGPATAAPAGGHGLLGMRERATAVGGQLRTGTGTGGAGGFLVEATLPTHPEDVR